LSSYYSGGRCRAVIDVHFRFDDKGHTVEPIDESELTSFDKKLKKALDYNPKENKL